VCPRDDQDRCGKSRPPHSPPGFDPLTAQPVAKYCKSVKFTLEQATKAQ